MASSIVLRITCMVLISMMVCAPLAHAAISCGTVQSSLAPCIPYVRNNGSGSVPPGCCKGIASVNAAAKTTADRQAVCECLKKAIGAIAGANPAVIAGLPGKCGVNVPYKISTSTNCKT
ncbi:hypothetical protein FH972_017039 [Carpinus fangiana]|uniref:Non-specific lipid-transfer protein n=1 Tax=Carpinus fangiana TaxID=176857 RepID=A0A5N6RJ02_9ROSI|nr:hypothetical protein FH972_017039 [Carpinus fangiana]